jgi:hypothetical protein
VAKTSLMAALSVLSLKLFPDEFFADLFSDKGRRSG